MIGKEGEVERKEGEEREEGEKGKKEREEGGRRETDTFHQLIDPII